MSTVLHTHLDAKERTDLWRPKSSFIHLKKRAQILNKIRRFFEARDVLEVDTPLMCRTAATDPYLYPIPAQYLSGSESEKLYLQTSPEFPMKRLLAAGSGSIFQICKAFRNDEVGKIHNPEFTILEWYRIGFNHHDLMDEMSDFLIEILQDPPAKRITYQDLFLQYVRLDPHTARLDELKNAAIQHDIHVSGGTEQFDQDDWLNLIMTHKIEPNLGFEQPIFIYNYPASQAALAKIRTGDNHLQVAERFEVYIRGMEMANGYHELSDAAEQLKRFQQDRENHLKLKREQIPIDQHLLSALNAGLPDCAGVALGIDRLMMLAMNLENIEEVISFTIDRV
jgi:lysyl-tRNA synthetase class 2